MRGECLALVFSCLGACLMMVSPGVDVLASSGSELSRRNWEIALGAIASLVPSYLAQARARILEGEPFQGWVTAEDYFHWVVAPRIRLQVAPSSLESMWARWIEDGTAERDPRVMRFCDGLNRALQEWLLDLALRKQVLSSMLRSCDEVPQVRALGPHLSLSLLSVSEESFVVLREAEALSVSAQFARENLALLLDDVEVLLPYTVLPSSGRVLLESLRSLPLRDASECLWALIREPEGFLPQILERSGRVPEFCTGGLALDAAVFSPPGWKIIRVLKMASEPRGGRDGA